MCKISIVVPCYNEEESINIFYNEAIKVLNSINETYEIIFVDDGSKDSTLSIIDSLSLQDKNIKYYSFSRNFGKESAMFAGLSHAKGEYVAVMDVDMQDPPSLLADMYSVLTNEDYDCVATRRVTRKGEPPLRTFFARMFYKIVNKISTTPIVDGARDFRLMKRDMVDSILSLNEYDRFSKGLFSWVGYKTKWLEYENIERVAGTTKWSFIKLAKYALDGIIDFSNFPIWFIIYSSIFFLLTSIIVLIITLVNGSLKDNYYYGLLAFLILFIGGVIVMCIGIVGLYIIKTFDQSRKRPHYIIKKSNDENCLKIK